MAESGAGGPIIGMGMSPVLRVAFGAVAGAVGLLPVGAETPRLSTAIPLGLAISVAVFLLLGRSSVRLYPNAVVMTSLVRREVIPWGDITHIGPERSFGRTRVSIRSVHGCWQCPLLLTPDRRAPWPRMGAQADALRAGWASAVGSGSWRPPPPRRPWGPDPLLDQTVRLGPVGLQAIVWSPLLFLGGWTYLYMVNWAMRDNWTAVVCGLAFAGLLALLTSRRRVLISPTGIEFRRLTTTVVPWSAVSAVSTVSGYGPYARAGHDPSVNSPVRVRIFTIVGALTLPMPLDDPMTPDPRFDGKVDFIRRYWEAHRGAVWFAPPPPLEWRPPPPSHA